MSDGHGASGNKTIIIVNNRVYETTAIPIGQRVNSAVARALILSGAATPQMATYSDQFPWTKPAK